MNETNTSTGQGSSWAIPAAIVVGFGLIAAAIYLGDSKTDTGLKFTGGDAPTEASLEELRPISGDDHIRGNPNAPVVIVEYSDFDCPFCQSFHTTMKKIMDEYGPTGDVAWVYRHFPLTSLHPSAGHIAEASECVAELGGNEAFWKFADMVFGERGVNEPTNVTKLGDFAEASGVSKTEFQTCLDSGRHKAIIAADMANAASIGAAGTPFSVVIAGDQMMSINGAQPYEQVKILIDGLVD